ATTRPAHTAPPGPGPSRSRVRPRDDGLRRSADVNDHPWWQGGTQRRDRTWVGTQGLASGRARQRALEASPVSQPTAPADRVLLATPRGFCAGVERAVTIVQRALEVYGAPVYVRRHIVHNIHVVESLRRLGAIFVEETTEVP